MRIGAPSRYTFTIGAAAALLAGCGGPQPRIGAPGAMPQSDAIATHASRDGSWMLPKAKARVIYVAGGIVASGNPSSLSMPASIAQPPHGKTISKIFSYTGTEQIFKVPARVTRVTISASGASGARCYGSGRIGLGGLVKAAVPVTPGESLVLFVGGAGTYYGGGFNGGASGGTHCGSSCAGGGGGASDVRQGGNKLQDRIVAAGGGGGQGCYDDGDGGAGGRLQGGAGANGASKGSAPGGGGGTGGTQSDGGRGGKGGTTRYGYCPGGDGSQGMIGSGGDGGDVSCDGVFGGGGGGGYYGGGGGGAGCGVCGSSSYASNGGGGGGGSSHLEKQAILINDKRGAAPPGNGQIIISWHRHRG